MSDLVQDLRQSIIEIKKTKAIEYAKLAIAEIEAQELTPNVALEGVTKALEHVGQLFQDGEYFLPELVYVGELAKEIMGILSPFLVAEGSEEDKISGKTIILGTVQGDMHEIGKNIVKTYAEGVGYHIIDLGMNVSSDDFIAAIKKHDARILGLSCLLTACDKQLYKITAALKEQGLNNVRVVIGGAAMTERLAEDVEKTNGIETRFAKDAITGVDIFKELSEGRE